MPLQPFTVDHFCAYARRLVLDTGESWELEEFQIEILEPILQGVREVWAIIPESNTKCLDVKTPLPTPEGWTTMLDVRPGDELLGSDGLPATVVAASEIKFGEDCYRVEFNDGSFVVCNGDHRWLVEDAHDHYSSQVHSTRFLYLRQALKKSEGTAARWRVQTAARRSSPDVDLPIDPYVLGVWLGDGNQSSGRVTNVDEGVWDNIRAAGYDIGNQQITTKAYTQTILGLHPCLRSAGLLGNKHIPEQYLIAAENERWALLQGLMDTDGCVSKAGQATYSSTNRRLANDVRRLAWSLGLPCSFNEVRSVLKGVDYGPSYQLTLSCDRRHPVARLLRKSERLKEKGSTCDHRRITSIERVASVPVKCVQVETPDRLYLAGESYVPTHNTTTMAAFAIYHCQFTRSPWVPIVASSRDQAEILARQAYGIIRDTPGLDRRFRIYEGYREIRSLQNGGRGIKVYAADVGTSDGGIPTLVLCDEGHRWPILEPYRLWKGKLGKRGGQIVMISTAGAPGEEFEETRDSIRNGAEQTFRDGCHARYEAPNIVLNEWVVSSPDLVSNMEAVKAANPFSGITVNGLTDEFKSPTTDLGEWKRLKCNIPSRTVQSAITEVEWLRAQVDIQIPPGEHVDVGMDVAWKSDTFALAPMWQCSVERLLELLELDADEDDALIRAKLDQVRLTELKGFNLLGPATILSPPRDGSMLHPDTVKIAFEEIDTANPVDAVVIDLQRAEDIAAWLEDEQSVTVIDGPQGNAAQIEYYDQFMKGLRNGTLKHSGDQGLHRHAMNAITRRLPGDKFRFDRSSQSRAKKKQVVRVIDALTAASMVQHYVGLFEDEGPTTPLVAWR